MCMKHTGIVGMLRVCVCVTFTYKLTRAVTISDFHYMIMVNLRYTVFLEHLQTKKIRILPVKFIFNLFILCFVSFLTNELHLKYVTQYYHICIFTTLSIFHF